MAEHMKMMENKQGAVVLAEVVLFLLMWDMIQTQIRMVIMVVLVNLIIGVFLKLLCIGQQEEAEVLVLRVKMQEEGQVMKIDLYHMPEMEELD